MNDQTVHPRVTPAFNLRTGILLVLPLLILGGIVALFLRTGGGLSFTQPAPVEALTFERSILKPGNIRLVVRNSGPQELTVAQTIINDAVWPFEISPTPAIPRLGTATIDIAYEWVQGEAYDIILFTTNAIPFSTQIPVAFTSPQPGGRTLAGFTLVGLYVGVIPVYLGLFWFPALRRIGKRWMTFLLAVTAGLLIFLGLDTLAEALEQAAAVPAPMQGVGMVGIGAITTFFLLDAISRRQTATGKNEAAQRLSLAYMIAIGIGLHNLGEGLAIGAAYNLGEISLGAFLVVGFILQNITEGLGIIAPVLRDRPSIGSLALMGLVGGGPAILGTWIGGFSPSATLGVLFLAIGTGAVFEVVYEIAKLIQKDVQQQPRPFTVFSGIVFGMLILWLTGLAIK